MIAAPYPATRLNWPGKLTGSSHMVQLLFHRSEGPIPNAAIEAAATRALEGCEVVWNWSGRHTKLMFKGKATIAMLEAAMTAIDAIHPTAQHFYTGDAMRPKRPKSQLPPVEMIAVHPRDLPREATAPKPPPGLFGGKLRDAWCSPRGVWIAAEYATDAWSICAVHKDRPAERPTITVPRHECSSVVFSGDGVRALIVGRWTIREVEVDTLAPIREVLVPRTIRDNNGYTSVLFHPTDVNRFIVGTETGVFLVAPNGDAPAFAHCLDVNEVALTANGHCVFARQVDPARGEMFALSGDVLRSIGTFEPIGELTVHGDRIFSRQSKGKAFEMVGGEAAWRACFAP